MRHPESPTTSTARSRDALERLVDDRRQFLAFLQRRLGDPQAAELGAARIPAPEVENELCRFFQSQLVGLPDGHAEIRGGSIRKESPR